VTHVPRSVPLKPTANASARESNRCLGMMGSLWDDQSSRTSEHGPETCPPRKVADCLPPNMEVFQQRSMVDYRLLSMAACQQRSMVDYRLLSMAACQQLNTVDCRLLNTVDYRLLSMEACPQLNTVGYPQLKEAGCRRPQRSCTRAISRRGRSF